MVTDRGSAVRRARRQGDQHPRRPIRMVRQAADAGRQDHLPARAVQHDVLLRRDAPEYFDWAEPVPGPDHRAHGRVARETGHRPDRAGLRAGARRALLQHRGGARPRRPDDRQVPEVEHSRSWTRRRAPSRGATRSSTSRPATSAFPPSTTPFARIGILICYDRHFPEAARVLGLGGAEILFVPTATTRMTRYLWDLELRAHAIANVYYVCGVNKVGVDVGGSRRDHHGNSMIAQPEAARSWPRPAPPRTTSRWPTWTCRRSRRCASSGATTATAAPTCTARRRGAVGHHRPGRGAPGRNPLSDSPSPLWGEGRVRGGRPRRDLEPPPHPDPLPIGERGRLDDDVAVARHHAPVVDDGEARGLGAIRLLD